MALFLVVDDSAIIRKGVRNILVAEGYETIEAENGNEALKMVEDHTPDCIILDLIMSEMGGIEVLKALSKKKNEDTCHYFNRRHPGCCSRRMFGTRRCIFS